MLYLAKAMHQLNFPALMAIYAEGNRENGADQWPGESPERQLQLAEERFRDYLAHVFFRTPGAVYCILQEDGLWVSALRLEPYKDGLLVEALETAPEYCRRGYGEKLLRAVQTRIGHKLYSHVHKKNRPSLALHEKCGFRRISEMAAYIDGSVNDRCCTLCWERHNFFTKN